MDRTHTPWFVLHSPELGRAFENFYEACNENGVLDRKTKELLMLALTTVFRSPNDSEEHLKRAFGAGATKEEVAEVLLITAAMGAWTQLALDKQMCLKYLDAARKEQPSDGSR
jgi:alkylhydroperoxidase/carboxymuconolactone decarboxylase family protein YurZ